MGAILAAVGAGLGVGQAVAGYDQAVQAKRRSQRQIYAAYLQARQQQLLSQRQGRESTTENLVGRGILSGGGQQGFARPANATPTTAYNPLQTNYSNGVIVPDKRPATLNGALAGTKVGTNTIAQAAAQYPDALTTTRSSPAQRKAQNYADAVQGATGQANTLGGQTETDLSQQNYLAGTNLDAERAALYNGTNVAGLQGEIGAIAGGVGTAIGAAGQFAGGGMPGIPSESSLPTAAFDPNLGSQIGIPSADAVNANSDHAFGVDAVNPVNPSGNVSVGSFNVLGSGGGNSNKNASNAP